MKFSDSDISTYYNVTRDHYNLFWKLDRNRSLHYGYWSDKTSRLSDALMEINALLARKAGIEDGMSILDAGCGEGGSMAWLARNFKVDVTGITLNERQMAAGNRFFAQQKLSDVRIQVQNFNHTTFPDRHFDLVWALESSCHAEEKRIFLEEMYRVLKPGGKIIVADFFVPRVLNLKDQNLIDKMANAWACPSFELISSFISKAEHTGFKIMSTKDITKNMTPSVRRLYYLFYLGLPISLGYNLLRPRTTAIAKRNVYSAYWQYLCFKRRLWTYQVIVAQKMK